MNNHYKVFQYSKLIYSFTTGTRTKEYCLEFIKREFDHLEFFSVKMNGETIYEKRSKPVSERSYNKISNFWDFK